MTQKNFTTPTNVLNEKGQPNAGYSTKGICTYDRKAIKAAFWRLKEWDFYQVSDGEKCLQFTIGHSSYAGQVTVMLFNFKTGEKIFENSKMLVLPFGS
ncbi:MAG: DUF2804 family protein, partial [Oscillospiraceae bacterium]